MWYTLLVVLVGLFLIRCGFLFLYLQSENFRLECELRHAKKMLTMLFRKDLNNMEDAVEAIARYVEHKEAELAKKGGTNAGHGVCNSVDAGRRSECCDGLPIFFQR